MVYVDTLANGLFVARSVRGRSRGPIESIEHPCTNVMGSKKDSEKPLYLRNQPHEIREILVFDRFFTDFKTCNEGTTSRDLHPSRSLSYLCADKLDVSQSVLRSILARHGLRLELPLDSVS